MSKKRKQPDHLSTLKEVAEIVVCSRTTFVDSGSGGTGWAGFYIPSRALWRPAHGKPHQTGVITPRAKTWICRIAQIGKGVPLMIKQTKPDYVVIEWPEIWVGSDKSYAAATSGALFQLAAACGALIEGINRMRREIEILLIVPREWKGQLKKPAVNARIKRAIGETYPNHVSDAVGMGLAVMGLL